MIHTMAKPIVWAAFAVALHAVIPAVASAAPPLTVSADAVTVWAPATQFRGDLQRLQPGSWQRVTAEQLPRDLPADPVMASKELLAAFHGETGAVTLYARQGDQLTRRAVIRPGGDLAPCRFRVIPAAAGSGLGIEVRDHDTLQYALTMSPDGMIELKPAATQHIVLADIRLSYAIVPSLIGTDLVYDPPRYGDKKQLYIPSMNLLAGLVTGGDSMMVAAWPPGRQVIRLDIDHAGTPRVIREVGMDLDHQNVYLRLLEHVNIWHAEDLKDTYLEQDTTIGWKPPLPALWIGYFYIESEQIGYPFFFGTSKTKLWGRFIRSWYEYPLWFGDGKTYVHFEKKFPPRGQLLIYYLQAHPGAPAVPSPVQVMQRGLGQELADKLLDREGIAQRPLLAHGNAVCAMTNRMQEIFDASGEVKQQAYIDQRADDVARFIEMIRQRIHEYGGFAAAVRPLLASRDLAAAVASGQLDPLQETIDEIALAAQEDVPNVSLDEVRKWADQIRRMAQQVRPDNSRRYKALAHRCRVVAGSQDDLARQLSVLAIRLMQQAAEIAVDSPQQARLAEQIITRCRHVLRRPTWWEPSRYYFPKSNPGIP